MAHSQGVLHVVAIGGRCGECRRHVLEEYIAALKSMKSEDTVASRGDVVRRLSLIWLCQVGGSNWQALHSCRAWYHGTSGKPGAVNLMFTWCPCDLMSHFLIRELDIESHGHQVHIKFIAPNFLDGAQSIG